MKAQMTALGAVLLVGILIAIIGSTYMWGKPIVEKWESLSAYEYAKVKQVEIRDAISQVAKGEGSQYSIALDLTHLGVSLEEGNAYRNESGVFLVDKNAIDIYTDQAIPVVMGGAWILIDPTEDNFLPIGQMESDGAGVVLAMNVYEKTHVRLWYRDLYDNETERYYRIQLQKSGITGMEGGDYKLVLKNTGEGTGAGLLENYTITNISVSLT